MGTEVQTVEAQAMSLDTVKAQVNLIQEVMRGVMKDGEHYGTVPGCGDKKTLLKPGAEKLSLTFRLAPAYDVQMRDMGHGHREYEVRCRLTHIPSGSMVGEGVGSCSTMEGKYRYRAESTGKPVPPAFWDTRDSELLGGPSYSARKMDGKWVIVHRVEHDNPADYYNTVLKMAKKRAHVDAILTATAASDIFTQDLEDMAENDVAPGDGKPAAKTTAKPADPAPANAPSGQLDPVRAEISEGILELAKRTGQTPENVLIALTSFEGTDKHTGQKTKRSCSQVGQLTDAWAGSTLRKLRKELEAEPAPPSREPGDEPLEPEPPRGQFPVQGATTTNAALDRLYKTVSQYMPDSLVAAEMEGLLGCGVDEASLEQVAAANLAAEKKLAAEATKAKRKSR